MADYKLYMSPSMLARVATCETQAALATLGYTGMGSSVPAAAGTVMHAGLADILRESTPTKALLDWKNTDLYRRLDDADTLDPEYRAENLAEILREWQRRYMNHLPMKIKGVEEAFDLNLGVIKIFTGDTAEFHLIGVMDFFGLDEASRVRIGETKTTRKQVGEDTPKTYAMDVQNSAYIYAASKIFAPRETVGSYINLIKMMKCPDSTKRCPRHWLDSENRATLYLECGPKHLVMEMFPIDRTPEQLADFEQQARRWAAQYLHLCIYAYDLEGIRHFANMNGMGVRDACQWCDGFDYCLASRPVDAVARELLRVRPPEPSKQVHSGLVKI